MTFHEKYKPTSQKALFHKDIITHYRKWIKNIEDNISNAKQILFLTGPISCGKSASTHILLKAFNVLNIDASDIRSSEKINELLQSIVDIDVPTFTNYLQKQTARKDSLNIIVVDNIELCEKNIKSFVDAVHLHFNIPIILICNNAKLRDLFNHYTNCTYLDFKKPSLLELTKLANFINESEKLNLTKDNIKNIIDIALCDTRQVFYILEHWSSTSDIEFESFITNIAQKHSDLDLVNKLMYMLDQSRFELTSNFSIATSDPIIISNSIFQSYPNVYGSTSSCSQLSLTSSCQLQSIVALTDIISHSNLIQHYIFNEQRWDLYDTFAFESCVLPSYIIKQRENNNLSEQDLFNNITLFKDISYNFITSLADIHQTSTQNILSKKYPSNNIQKNVSTVTSSDGYFVANIIINYISKIFNFCDLHKRGKNTSKQEKLDLYNKIKADSSIQSEFDSLINLVYNYKLFELDTNTNEFLTTKDNFTQYEKNVQKIDLRILKRYLNVFTISHTDTHTDISKLLKSHIETIIKYGIFDLLNALTKHQTVAVSRNIDTLVENLENIWKF